MPNPRPFTLPPHLRAQGHEDLRQDERVMQLFGLVNTMLANDRTTAERDLSIARYAVIPLSYPPSPSAAPPPSLMTLTLHLPLLLPPSGMPSSRSRRTAASSAGCPTATRYTL